MKRNEQRQHWRVRPATMIIENPPTRPLTLQVPTMALEEWMEPRMYSSIAASLSTANAGGGAAAPEDEACRVGPQHWRMKLAAPVDASCSSAACVAHAQLVKAHPHKAHPPMLPGSSWLQALHNAMHVLQQPTCAAGEQPPTAAAKRTATEPACAAPGATPSSSPPALPGNSSPLTYSARGPCCTSSRAQCTPDLVGGWRR